MSRFKALSAHTGDNESQNFYGMNTTLIEKKTRKGLAYSPYTFFGSSIRKSKRLANNAATNSAITSTTNNNDSEKIESHSLIQKIIEDQMQDRLQSNSSQTNNNNNTASSRRIPIPVYVRVPPAHEPEDWDAAIQEHHRQNGKRQTATPPVVVVDAHHDGGGDDVVIIETSDVDDDHNESRRRSQTKSDQIHQNTGNQTQDHELKDGRSDSVIFTGTYSQHDIDLEQVSKINTNGKFPQLYWLPYLLSL